MSGTGFEEEQIQHRQAPCEINTAVDFDDILSRRRPATENGLLPFYPSTSREGYSNILYGEVVHRLRGTNLGDTRVYGSTSLAGAGAEAQALFPNEPEMVKAAIKNKYDILGLACTEYNHATDAQDQGYVTAVSGGHTIGKAENKIYEPGVILRAELPLDDPSFAQQAKLGLDGRPLGKYAWRVVPEDYNTPGDSLLTHISAILEDEVRWRQAMGPSKNIEIDKWLACFKACTDSALMDGLLMIYVLMKMGFLLPGNPEVLNPYQLPEINQRVMSGGINNTMTPSAFVTRMAELLNVQQYTGSSQIPSQGELTFFDTMRRIITGTQFFTGKIRTFEFGQREGQNVASPPTRNSTGAVEPSTREGMFLHNQLNHFRKRLGTELQALDDHARFRIGRATSGPSRRKRINVILEKTVM